MDKYAKWNGIPKNVILTKKEMKIIELIRIGHVKVRDVAKEMGFTYSHTRDVMYDMREMGWLEWDEVKGFLVNDYFEFRVVKIRNGAVQDDEERELVKKREPLKATFERKDIRHTPPITIEYTVTPEEAKQMFIDATKHLPNLEYKKGVYTRNENYNPVHRSG